MISRGNYKKNIFLLFINQMIMYILMFYHIRTSSNRILSNKNSPTLKKKNKFYKYILFFYIKN